MNGVYLGMGDTSWIRWLLILYVGIGGTISEENRVGMERKYLICDEYLIM